LPAKSVEVIRARTPELKMKFSVRYSLKVHPCMGADKSLARPD